MIWATSICPAPARWGTQRRTWTAWLRKEVDWGIGFLAGPMAGCGARRSFVEQAVDDDGYSATVAKLCGARLPKQAIDGIDWLTLLKGDDSVTPRDHFFYYYRKNSLEAVRKGDWKLVFAHPGRTYEGLLPGQGGKPGPNTENHAFPMALYNLQRDPGERYDVREQHPEIIRELEKLAEEVRTDLGDDIQSRSGRNVRAAGTVDTTK